MPAREPDRHLASRRQLRRRPSAGSSTTPSCSATSRAGSPRSRTPARRRILVSSIPFTITPRGGGDYGLTGTLANISRLLSGRLQVTALGFIINASTNGYVRNPTSCELNFSTGQATGYDDPTFVDGPPYSFATTGCEQMPFAPKVSLTVGDRGSTAFNKFPPIVLKITQAAGEADEMGNKVTLPIELNTNNTAYTLCSQAQADSDTLSRRLEVRLGDGAQPLPVRAVAGTGLSGPADCDLAARACCSTSGPGAREGPDEDHADQRQADPVARPERPAAAGLGPIGRAQRRQEDGRVPEPRGPLLQGRTRRRSSTRSRAS